MWNEKGPDARARVRLRLPRFIALVVWQSKSARSIPIVTQERRKGGNRKNETSTRSGSAGQSGPPHWRHLAPRTHCQLSNGYAQHFFARHS